MEGLVQIVAITCVLVSICCMIYIGKTVLSYMMLKMEQLIEISLDDKERQEKEKNATKAEKIEKL